MSILSKEVLIIHTAYLRNEAQLFLVEDSAGLCRELGTGDAGRHCDTFHTSLCTRYLVSGYAYFMTKSVQGILGLSHM